jgi:predicted translin family RNA/ssDNA-binding protein
MTGQLFCWQFEYTIKKCKHITGVCAYTLSEARRYFIEKLRHENMEQLIPSVELIEPNIFSDTEGMTAGWR